MRELREWLIEKLGGIPQVDLQYEIKENEKLNTQIEELLQTQKNIENVSDSWRERGQFLQGKCETLEKNLEITNIQKEQLVELLIKSKGSSPSLSTTPPDLEPIRTTTVPWSRARRELEKKDRESLGDKNAKVS